MRSGVCRAIMFGFRKFGAGQKQMLGIQTSIQRGILCNRLACRQRFTQLFSLLPAQRRESKAIMRASGASHNGGDHKLKLIGQWNLQPGYLSDRERAARKRTGSAFTQVTHPSLSGDSLAVPYDLDPDPRLELVPGQNAIAPLLVGFDKTHPKNAPHTILDWGEEVIQQEFPSPRSSSSGLTSVAISRKAPGRRPQIAVPLFLQRQPIPIVLLPASGVRYLEGEN